MNERVVGTCGACGGRVMVPTVWHGVVPPVPRCKSCKSEVQEGPVLPMKPRRGVGPVRSFVETEAADGVRALKSDRVYREISSPRRSRLTHQPFADLISRAECGDAASAGG